MLVKIDNKLIWKENCEQLSYAISKYIGAMYKVKHYVRNLGLRKL